MKRLWWTALVVTLLLAACGGGGGEGDNSSGTSTTTTLPDVGSAGMVGAAGGTVVSDDGKLRLDIPAGALTEETQVEVVEVPAADLGLDVTALTGAVYDLLPDGLTFSAPVTVIRSFDAAAAGIGTDEIPWMIMAHGGTEGWEFLSSTTTRRGDTVEVSAEVTHFTGNAVVEVHRILAFDAETKLTLTPASFTADVGSGAQVALSVEIARAINRADVDVTLSWSLLTPPLTGNPGDTGGMVTCDKKGNGTYSATLNVRDTIGEDDDDPVFAQLLLGGTYGFHTVTSPTFDLTVVGSATCNPKAGADATSDSPLPVAPIVVETTGTSVCEDPDGPFIPYVSPEILGMSYNEGLWTADFPTSDFSFTGELAAFADTFADGLSYTHMLEIEVGLDGQPAELGLRWIYFASPTSTGVRVDIFSMPERLELNITGTSVDGGPFEWRAPGYDELVAFGPTVLDDGLGVTFLGTILPDGWSVSAVQVAVRIFADDGFNECRGRVELNDVPEEDHSVFKTIGTNQPPSLAVGITVNF